MIPKKIHLIWLGGNRPSKFDFLLQEIKRINFDYEVFEWNESNIDFELINKELFEKSESFGAKSDILRFEVLFNHGGIYMDYDFLQIKKFDDLLNCDFFVGSPSGMVNEVWNSIIGSSSQNRICKDFLNELIGLRPYNKNEISRIMEETGSYHLTRLLEKDYSDLIIKKIHGTQFYPFPGSKRELIKNLSLNDLEYAKSFKDDKTYCIHLHTTTWQ